MTISFADEDYTMDSVVLAVVANIAMVPLICCRDDAADCENSTRLPSVATCFGNSIADYYYYYYLIFGIGPQRINTEGIACSKVFFLYPKGNLVKK